MVGGAYVCALAVQLSLRTYTRTVFKVFSISIIILLITRKGFYDCFAAKFVCSLMATQKLLFIMLDQRDLNDTLTVNCFTSVIGPKSSSKHGYVIPMSAVNV